MTEANYMNDFNEAESRVDQVKGRLRALAQAAYVLGNETLGSKLSNAEAALYSALESIRIGTSKVTTLVASLSDRGPLMVEAVMAGVEISKRSAATQDDLAGFQDTAEAVASSWFEISDPRHDRFRQCLLSAFQEGAKTKPAPDREPLLAALDNLARERYPGEENFSKRLAFAAGAQAVLDLTGGRDRTPTRCSGEDRQGLAL